MVSNGKGRDQKLKNIDGAARDGNAPYEFLSGTGFQLKPLEFSLSPLAILEQVPTYREQLLHT